jgi:hypothetical protein
VAVVAAASDTEWSVVSPPPLRGRRCSSSSP